MKKVTLLTVFTLLFSLGYSFADVPCKINYQGRLIKDNVPVHNPTPGVPMTFKVDGEDVYSGGNVPVYNGLFRVVLDLEGIDWTAGEEKSLEVTVDGELLSPAEPIYAYPYAINSHLLEGSTKEYFLNVSDETQKKDGGLNIIGNVGIGTTSPSQKLDVVGSIGLGARIYPGLLGTESGYSMVHFKNIEADKAGAIRASQGTSDNPDAPLRYEGSKHTFNTTNYTTRMVILDNGNVGIGTTSPQAKLDVAGNLRATGGIEPDWDSGWVFVDRINQWGLKTLTHNLNYFPRQIQWWFSNGNPGTFIGPLASNTYKDHCGNPLGIWITLTQVKFSIWHNRYVYRMFNASTQQWSTYNNGYYRILLWK